MFANQDGSGGGEKHKAHMVAGSVLHDQPAASGGREQWQWYGFMKALSTNNSRRSNLLAFFPIPHRTLTCDLLH